MTSFETRFHVGCSVIRAAGRLARRHFENRHVLQIESKGTQDVVSIADREVEELIRAELGAAFPEDGFLGEEGGGDGAGDGVWVIDPIDGTANFLRGIATWCISMGYLRRGEFVLGMIYDPMADELFAAQQGAGAWLNGARLSVSGTTAIDQAIIGLGFSYRRPAEPFAAAIGKLLSAHCEMRRAGSGALGMAYVAAGRTDGYYEAHINSWDVAAGIVLVREAGGWTSDFLAGDGLMAGNPILACTPALRDPLVALLEPR